MYPKKSIKLTLTLVNSEKALDMLKKTNIDELSDAECRELLKDMASVPPLYFSVPVTTDSTSSASRQSPCPCI